MFEDIKKELSSFKLLTILLTIAVAIFLLQFVWQFLGYFSEAIVMIIIAWLLSFVMDPITDRVSKITRTERPVAALISFILALIVFAAVIFLFVPAITFQLEGLSRILPEYLETAPGYVQRWNESLLETLDSSIGFLPSVASFFFNVFLIFILAYYLIVDGERINKQIISVTPKNWRKSAQTIHGIINKTFANFIRVQLIFALIYGIATWIVLRILSIDFAASTALLAGILTIVPFIGPVLGIIPPLFISFIIDPFRALIVFIILLVAQQIIFNIWGPRFMGKTFRIHPIVVLLSFVIGLKIAGLIGAILAVPVIGIISVIIRDLGKQFISSEIEE